MPEETRTHDGMTLTLRRRRLTFIEEQRLLPHVLDPKTRAPDLLELCARTIETGAVEGVNFKLTGDRIRALGNDPEQSSLAWFLIDWICKDTTENLSPKAHEVALGKSGAPLRGAPGTRMPRKPSRGRNSAASASPNGKQTPSPRGRSS